MSQCSLTFPPFKKLSVHEHYETKLDQEIVYLIISGVSNLLISGEESKHTKKILKELLLTRELQTYRTLTRTQREEATVNMVNVNCSIAFFHGIIQPFKLFRTTCKGESQNRVVDRSDRIYIHN